MPFPFFVQTKLIWERGKGPYFEVLHFHLSAPWTSHNDPHPVTSQQFTLFRLGQVLPGRKHVDQRSDEVRSYRYIRANCPDHVWLAHLRKNPEVELRRRGRTSTYRAALFERVRSEVYVEASFREKYGLADQWREWTSGNHTVMVRLQPR